MRATHNRMMPATTTSTPKTRGRKPDASSTSGKIRDLLATGLSASDIAKKLGCTPALVYNVKARMANGGKKSGRGPGRPPKAKAAPTGTMGGLGGILDMVKKNESERARLVGALQKVAELVRAALA